MLALCKQHGLTIAQLMMANETVWRPEAETRAGLLTIWKAMQDYVNCVYRIECITRPIVDDQHAGQYDQLRSTSAGGNRPILLKNTLVAA